jgi:hypothetical protein
MRLVVAAQPSEPTRRRLTAAIRARRQPARVRARRRYSVDVLAGNEIWWPAVTVGDGEETGEAHAHVHLSNPMRPATRHERASSSPTITPPTASSTAPGPPTRRPSL